MGERGSAAPPPASVTSGAGTSGTGTPQRRPELDAIRVLVVVGLVFFHSALVFDTRDDYYVKNAATTDVTMYLAGLAVLWAMPMLFLVSGVGSWYSLRRRGAGGFAVERLRRLGVPLLFATFVLLPLPQWLRRLGEGGRESYPEFLGLFFDVHLDLTEFPFVVRGDYFESGHLWFVVLLLAFSLLLAPAVRWFPRDAARRAGEMLAAAVRVRGMVLLLPAIPLALVSALHGMEEGFAAWSRWAYLLFFLYGYAIAADPRLREAMRREAIWAVAATLVLFGIGMPVFLVVGETTGADPFTVLIPAAMGARAMYGAAGWCCLVAILGLLDRRRSRGSAAAVPPASAGSPGSAGSAGSAERVADAPPGRARRVYAYLAEAALPLYILHQPAVVAVAYQVVRWDAPILVKYPMIVIAAGALTLAAYDLLVRRTPVTRFLFGMRPAR